MFREKKKILIHKIKSTINLFYSGIADQLFKFKKHENSNLLEKKMLNYKFYLFNQKLKTFFRLGRLRSSYDTHLKKFEEEFKNIDFLGVKKILCVAARLGTEVHALRNLNYDAIGIDIYVTKNNKYVHYGEFEKIPYEDKTFDAVYTNSVDHIYNIKKTVNEFDRVLNKDGYLLVNLMKGIEEGHEMAGTYESLAWKKRIDILSKIQEINKYELIKEVDLNTHSTLYILKKNN